MKEKELQKGRMKKKTKKQKRKIEEREIKKKSLKKGKRRLQLTWCHTAEGLGQGECVAP